MYQVILIDRSSLDLPTARVQDGRAYIHYTLNELRGGARHVVGA